MKEYFITANSFAAPFFSDSSTEFVEASSPQEALTKFAKRYKHPCGLYSAAAYESSDQFHKGRKPLATWLSNHAAKLEELTKDGSHAIYGKGPGCFQVDGVEHKVEDPKGGFVVA